jgi:uncharacterized surface protein with fasciclin (FAS1) repeats
MKTLKLNALALIAFLAIGITSCSDDDTTTTPVNPGPGSIAAIASANPNLSLLVKALGKAGLVQTLSDAGTYTVFAPNNAAFEAAGYNAVAIDALPAGDAGLKQILFNHLLATKKTAAELTSGYVKTFAKGAASTTNNLSMYVDATSGVKLNGISKVDATLFNIQASNGIIHVVDKVITLPTIVDLAVANAASFSSLTGALSSNGLVPTLQGAGPFTVFAPTNAAFTSLNLELADLQIVPTSAQLTSVLKYHVVSGNVLAATLPAVIAAGPVTTLNTQTFVISATPSPNITGKFLPVRPASKITNTDVQGSNGVIHVIDKVLLPTL